MKKDKVIDFATCGKDYQDNWLALSSDETAIVAHDLDLKRAIEKAEKKGEKNPVMIKMLDPSASYIL